MKNNLITIILILILGAFSYEFYFKADEPCKEPIPYAIGTFDKKFNISQEYFLSALAEAEDIWEKPKGEYQARDLFAYAPLDTSREVLKVNLIYDYRQEATSKLTSLGIRVSDSRASYDTLKAKFTALKAEYEHDKNIFNARVLAFNQKQQAYDDDVKFWNGKGGAPQKEYDKLEATKRSLEAESKELKNMQTNLNNQVEEINALVVVLNRLVSTLNLSVDKYNTVNVSRGESFEEGVYSTDGTNSEINIYEWSSREKLVRVLAHELGHALGLDHVPDPKAIMYELNQGNTQTLSVADLLALEAKCGAVQ